MVSGVDIELRLPSALEGIEIDTAKDFVFLEDVHDVLGDLFDLLGPALATERFDPGSYDAEHIELRDEIGDHPLGQHVVSHG